MTAHAGEPELATPKERIAKLRRVASEVTAPAAVAVDRDARFPRETFDALKQLRMLSAYVPREHGGYGASVAELFAMTEALGERCASSAMVFAMHQIQVACLVRHGLRAEAFRDYIGRLVSEQRLIASVTSGSRRRRLGAHEHQPDRARRRPLPASQGRHGGFLRRGCG
ncbi:MAG: acyl-CoA dehydrogenase family protein [Polyangiales bacterium]